MVTAIPKTNTNLAGFSFGFGATVPPPGATLFPVPVPVLVPAAGLWRSESGEMCELLHTSTWLSPVSSPEPRA